MFDDDFYGEEYEGLPYKKADLLQRGAARVVDFLIAGALFISFYPIGPLGAITYLLIADGLKSGPSLGKRLMGLRVVSVLRGGEAADLRESILRNSVFALVVVAYFVVGWIPYIGVLAVVLVGAGVVGAEAWLASEDEKGLRYGDRVAGTIVVGVVGVEGEAGPGEGERAEAQVSVEKPGTKKPGAKKTKKPSPRKIAKKTAGKPAKETPEETPAKPEGLPGGETPGETVPKEDKEPSPKEGKEEHKEEES